MQDVHAPSPGGEAFGREMAMHCSWVKINLNRLTVRLWQSQGKWFGDWDLRRWLEQAGFEWTQGSWYTCNGNLHLLEPDEIIELQTRETQDGITFVNRTMGQDRRPPSP